MAYVGNGRPMTNGQWPVDTILDNFCCRTDCSIFDSSLLYCSMLLRYQLFASKKYSTLSYEEKILRFSLMKWYTMIVTSFYLKQ